MINFIGKNPNKVAHFIVGLLLAQFLYCIPQMYIFSIPFIVAIIALFKEILKRRNFDKYNILAVIIGDVIGFGNMYLFCVIYNL